MKYQKKATFWNMSFSGSPRCYDSVVENCDNLRLGIKVTNDDTESALGVFKHNIQRGKCVAIRSAAEVINTTRNHICNRPIVTTKIVNQNNKKGDTKEGVFHHFAADIQEFLIVVGIEDAP